MRISSPLLALLALAVTLPAGRARADELPRPDLKEWQLPNGLDVVYLGVHRAPVVAVQVWYHVGSKEEARDRRGSAHMFEHMMFKGTVHVPPEEHARLIDRIGGSENAFTREDVTAYHEEVPRQYLDFAIQLEAERMRNLLIRQATVDSEREVVKEEKRSRIDNNPILRAFERFLAIAYTKHPYAWTPAGQLEDLDRLTPGNLKAFYDLYYQPNNATLVIVGDVSEDEARAAAEKWFGAIPAGPTPPRPAKATPEPKQTQGREEVVGSAQLGIVINGYHVPEARSADIPALKVLEAILGGGESSRLYQRVVRKDQSGVVGTAQLMVREEPGLLLTIGAFLAPDQVVKVKAGLLDEAARVQKEPVTALELTKAKNQLTAHFIYGLEDVAGLANHIGESKTLTGDAKAWLDEYKQLNAVTAEDVQRVAKQYLGTENLTTVIVPPAGGAK